MQKTRKSIGYINIHRCRKQEKASTCFTQNQRKWYQLVPTQL